MPLSAVDDRVALIVIDLQSGILALPTVHDSSAITDRARALAEAFRERSLPVVLVNVAGSAPGRTDGGPGGGALPADWTVLSDELGRAADDITVTKHTWGAFTGTGLDGLLRERDVTQVAIVGIATSVGVESTARFAAELGYHVVLVTDAMTDMSAASHDHSVDAVFPRLGETTTTDELLRALPAVRR